VAESLRSAIEHKDLTDGKITISVGVASPQDEPIANVEDFFRAADAALYQAKYQGRNRVVRFAGASPPGT
jgi:diguanylate cyclase (GGDEF)-like protein